LERIWKKIIKVDVWDPQWNRYTGFKRLKLGVKWWVTNVGTLTSLSLCNFVYTLKFTLWRLFVSSYYLFNTACFSLTGHQQVYKIADENCRTVPTLLYFAFYKKCEMLIKYFIFKIFFILSCRGYFCCAHMFGFVVFGVLVSFHCAGCSKIMNSNHSALHKTKIY
jgi:hypothetical protein